MSSLVTEALANAGSLAKDDWSTKISKLSLRAFDVKQELYDFTEQCYVDFLPLLTSSEQINSKLATIKSEVNNLQLSLDTMVKTQIKDSTKEFEQLSKEHTKTLNLVNALEKLNIIHSGLTNHSTQLHLKNLYKAAAQLYEIEEFLNGLEGNPLVEVKIYQALRMDFVVKKENLLYTLNEIWNECIIMNLQDDSNSKVELSINFNRKNGVIDGQDLVYAMKASKYLENKMKKLSKGILESFVKPCVLDRSFQPTVKYVSTTSTLSIDYVHTQEKNSIKAVSPEIAFAKLEIVLSFLYDNLLKYQLFPNNTNNDQTLMTIFRSNVAEDLITLLIDRCLMDSVPETKDGLQAYDKVEEEVKKFENLLQTIGFLPKDSTEESNLVRFVSNVHVHFANQRCTSVLAKARSLMKAEIHETIQINTSSYGEIPANFLAKLRRDQIPKNELVVEAVSKVLKPSNPLHDRSMCLPRLRISKGVKEIMDLAYETLCEACNSSVECALRLVATTENIFELFSAVVPIHHRESLLTLPQVSAIHYNDCWFISHHLLTLGHQFSAHLPSQENPLTFVHLVPKIRRLGNDCFLQQMRRQREILLECLSPLKKFSPLPNEDKFKIAEKPLKQASLQLCHLHKVWFDVLPPNILQTSLAALADSVIIETISCICALEDISSDDSAQLSAACRLLQNQLHSLFNDESDSDLSWQKEIKKWQRLDELIRVLESNLRTIVDRWSDGKGPLATVFTVVEVKGLIRALFQNTEQRANAISKIRY